jgi:HEAT repeat protein
VKDKIETLLHRLATAKDKRAALKELNWSVIPWSAVKHVRGSLTRSADSLIAEEKLSFVVGLLEHQDSQVRGEAALLLGQLGGANHLLSLQSLIQNPRVDPDTKVAACEALATIGGPLAVETLISCTLPGNPDKVVQAAVLDLHSIPGASGVLGPAGGPGGYIKEAIDLVAEHHPSRAVRLLARSMSGRL